MRETVYTETWGGKAEYWTYSDHQRVFISHAAMRRMCRQGAELIRLNA